MAGEDRGDNQREHEIRKLREERYRRSYTDATGALRGDLRRLGIRHVHAMRHLAARRVRMRPPGAAGIPRRFGALGLAGALWESIGPAPLRIDAEQIFQGTGPVSGLVDDIAIDPTGTADQVVYIAARWGGIWKSTDGGATWVPKMDGLISEATSAMALDPANPSIVYAGTTTFTSMGLFKSIDGGDTWTLLGSRLFSGRDINVIVLPAPGVLLVATDFGLFRSVDGGQNFGNNPPQFDNDEPILFDNVTALRLDTASPATTVLAAVSGSGLFRSTDAGVTFPTNLFSNPGAPAAGTYQYVAFAQSTAPDNQTLYAYAQADPVRGLFKSIDGGNTWAELPSGATCASQDGGAQLGYDQTIGVDPQDANRVYLGFQELYASTDGGVSFGIPAISRSQIHWDHHALVFSPRSHWAAQAPTRLWVGTDGGVASSPDGGGSFANLNEGIGTNLFYGIDLGRGGSTANAYTYGGCQDTGTVERRPTFAGRDWHLGVDGDGGPVAVDWHDSLRCYGTDDDGYMHTTDAGATWAHGGVASAVRQVAADPNVAGVVYALSTNQLFLSTDGGVSFTLVQTFGAELVSISIAYFDSDTVWVGLDDGSVARTHDASAGAGASWTSFTAGLPTGRAAAAIAIDPSNQRRVVAGYDGVSGIPPGDRTQHVYLTTDDGASWNDISGTDGGVPTENFPDLAVNSVAVDADPAVGLFGVAAVPGLIAAVGQAGTVLSSPDALSWAAHASGSGGNLVAVAWDGAGFVAAGLGGAIVTSPDASAWTVRKMGPDSEALQGVAFSGFRYVVTSASEPMVYTSTDAVTWSPQTVPGGQALGDVVWAANQFVAVGFAGTVLTSPDGLAWTVRVSGTPGDLVCVAYSGSRLVAGGLQGTLISSPNGVNWTVRASGTTDEINGLAWSGSVFVAVLNSGDVLTSPDGDVWTLRTGPTGNRLNDVAWTGSQFVAVGDFGSIYTSPDGVNWTDHSVDAVLHSILACCDAGVLQTTDLGATWQVLGVGLPKVRCTSLALDATANPSLLRVGTYGRSVWELVSPSGARLVIEADLAFGLIPAGSAVTLTAQLYNVGSDPLTILNVARTSGSADFLAGGLTLPLTVPPGGEADLTVAFNVSGTGDRTAVITVTSDDVVAPTQTIPASGTGT